MTHTNDQGTHGVEQKHANHDESCVFCKIVAGDIPAVKIFENDAVLAFLDIKPVNKGHVLVIPKDHFENIYTVPPELWCRVMLAVQEVSVAVKNAVSADGINLVMNNESAAGQLVYHAHIHVVPRENEDGLVHWPHKNYDDEEDAKSVAEKIRVTLRD